MSGQDRLRDRFFGAFDAAERRIAGDEVLLASFVGECSDFVRWNGSRVRQAGTVEQARIELSLVRAGKRAVASLTLGEGALVDAQLAGALAALRDDLEGTPPDPYLLYSTDADRGETVRAGELPSAQAAIETIAAAAGADDLVGIFAAGPLARGFASSHGARLWHAADAFHFDWSLAGAHGRAVKASYAGSAWDARELAARIDASRTQLAVLEQPLVQVPPGDYRVYLAPAAVDELVAMLNWDGVSAKAQRTHASALDRLVAGEAALSPLVSLTESIGSGLAPAFDDLGFARPQRVPLIDAGRHAGALISARTAREYGIDANGASPGEAMQAAELGAGALAAGDALAALDEGIYVSNLWYLNYSDRRACRMTGMTRFATVRVQGGRAVGPLAPMRFDDSLYRLLGSELIALSAERDWIVDADTYGHRSVRTSRMPGAMVGAMRFTL